MTHDNWTNAIQKPTKPTAAGEKLGKRVPALIQKLAKDSHGVSDAAHVFRDGSFEPDAPRNAIVEFAPG